MNTQAHSCRHAQICMPTHTQARTHTHTYTSARINIDSNTLSSIWPYKQIPTYIPSYPPKSKHKHACTHGHTNTCVHTYMQTHSLTLTSAQFITLLYAVQGLWFLEISRFWYSVMGFILGWKKFNYKFLNGKLLTEGFGCPDRWFLRVWVSRWSWLRLCDGVWVLVLANRASGRNLDT